MKNKLAKYKTSKDLFCEDKNGDLKGLSLSESTMCVPLNIVVNVSHQTQYDGVSGPVIV